MLRALVALVFALSLSCSGSANADAAPDPESPRAAVESYLEAARREDYATAAHYLDLPAAERSRAELIAERLKFVLERSGVNPAALSADAKGDLEDGLPEGVDRVAGVASGRGKPEDVLVARIATDAGKRWKFSADTLKRVNGWYDRLEERWLLERLPNPLLRSGPFGLLVWQWLALLAVAVVGWVLGMLLGRITIGFLKRVARRTPTRWDDLLVARKRGPVILLWAAAACWVFLPVLDLYPAADATLRSVLRLTVYVALFWALTRSADVFAAHAAKWDPLESTCRHASLSIL